jgi:hypothetical protein
VILAKVKGKVDQKSIDEIRKSFEKEDEIQMTYAIERIIDDVERKGILEGEARGEARKALETARNMFRRGRPLIEISEDTQLPIEILEKEFGTAN